MKTYLLIVSLSTLLGLLVACTPPNTSAAGMSQSFYGEVPVEGILRYESH